MRSHKIMPIMLKVVLPVLAWMSSGAIVRLLNIGSTRDTLWIVNSIWATAFVAALIRPKLSSFALSVLLLLVVFMAFPRIVYFEPHDLNMAFALDRLRFLPWIGSIYILSFGFGVGLSFALQRIAGVVRDRGFEE